MINEGWLADLYEGTEGYIEARCFIDHECSCERSCEQCTRVRFCKDIGELTKFLKRADASDHWNVYVGMATRVRKGDGTKLNCTQARSLWIDFDYDDHGGAQSGAAKFNEKAAGFNPPPSCVVDSGGGIHAYWYLEEPHSLDTHNKREEFECTLKGLQSYWESDGKVCDVARILRVPGTRNWPDPKKLKKGRVLSTSCVRERSGHLYSYADFDEFTERGKAERAKRPAAKSSNDPVPIELPEPVRNILETSPKARALYLHKEEALPRSRSNPQDLSGSVFDYHLMGELIQHASVTREQMVIACQLARSRAGKQTKADRPDYWERTYRAILSARRPNDVPDASDYAARMRQLIRNPSLVLGSATIVEQPFSMEIDPTLRYSTGIASIDSALDGGMYGFSAVGGPKNVGKSVFLMNTGLSASRPSDGVGTGWTVAYFDTENAGNVWNRRVWKWLGSKPEPEVQLALRTLRRMWVKSGVTRDDLIEFICSAIQKDTTKLLIIIDSLNTLIDKMCRVRGDYFEIYGDLMMWMQDVRVACKGYVGFCVASQLNKEGELLGRKIEYTEDCGVIISEDRKKDALTILLDKTRETKKQQLPDFVVDDNFRLLEKSLLDEAGSYETQDDPQPDRQPTTLDDFGNPTDAAGPWWEK